MIERVRFRNFKSLDDVTLDLDRLTVLVGPNGAGKSSVLQAIYLAVHALDGDDPGWREIAGATDQAEPEVEAWHVSGFAPRDPAEADLLRAIREDLSFDPTTEAHRLTSHPTDAPTDAKRVLSRLCGDDPDRELECLADRVRLRDRGDATGLRAFLDEVEGRSLPLFGVPA